MLYVNLLQIHYKHNDYLLRMNRPGTVSSEQIPDNGVHTPFRSLPLHPVYPVLKTAPLLRTV